MLCWSKNWKTARNLFKKKKSIFLNERKMVFKIQNEL